MRRAFTLIEVLVVIAIIAVLVAFLVPTLSAARESGRSIVCLSNLRQCSLMCRLYADENKGFGPAVGQPYGGLPNWALVVAASAGQGGATSAELYSERSVLVCPSVTAAYGRPMLRTYAMNATGRAGYDGDSEDYDNPNAPVFLNFEKVLQPGRTVMLMDGAAPPAGSMAGDAPPPSRCSSVVDFRQKDHRDNRIGWFHGSGRKFDTAMFDGSANIVMDIPTEWLDRLP